MAVSVGVSKFYMEGFFSFNQILYVMTFHLGSPCSKYKVSIGKLHGVVTKQILAFYGIAEALVDHHILISRVCSARAG